MTYYIGLFMIISGLSGIFDEGRTRTTTIFMIVWIVLGVLVTFSKPVIVRIRHYLQSRQKDELPED